MEKGSLTVFRRFTLCTLDIRCEPSGTVFEGKLSASLNHYNISADKDYEIAIQTSVFSITTSTSESPVSLADPESVSYSVSASLPVFGFGLYRVRFFGFSEAADTPNSSSCSSATAAANLLLSLVRTGRSDDNDAERF
jgi:hypothetical protein